MRQRLSALAVILLIAMSPLHAHDFWLSATNWRPAPGSTSVTITGGVGEKFPVVTDGAAPAGVEKWRVIGPNGDLPATRGFRRQGQLIATSIAMKAPGTYLGVMTVRARVIAMDGKEFTDYLREEGLEDVIAERAKLGQTDVPARERYARYAKVVVRKGDGPSAHVTRPTGLKAEVVPATDPSTISPGESLVVQFLVEGQPVAGVQLSAVSEESRLDVRTDAEGRAAFVLPNPGPWLIKTVHMIRPAAAGSPPADWESYWVTLTFNAEARSLSE